MAYIGINELPPSAIIGFLYASCQQHTFNEARMLCICIAARGRGFHSILQASYYNYAHQPVQHRYHKTDDLIYVGLTPTQLLVGFARFDPQTTGTKMWSLPNLDLGSGVWGGKLSPRLFA